MKNNIRGKVGVETKGVGLAHRVIQRRGEKVVFLAAFNTLLSKGARRLALIVVRQGQSQGHFYSISNHQWLTP